MKDWITYIDEYDKVKAWDVTFEHHGEIVDLIESVGLKVVGSVAFKREVDAINYTEQVLL